MVSENNPRAEELIQSAYQSIQRRNLNAARDALSQAELLNPRQRGLWAMYGALYGMQNQNDKAIESMRKELQMHADETQVYQGLAEMEIQMDRMAEAEATLRDMLKALPGDIWGSEKLADVLTRNKQYDEAIGILDKALVSSPADSSLKLQRTNTLLEAGRKQEGLAAAKEIGSGSPDAMTLNDLAYELAIANLDLSLARGYANRSVALLEDNLKNLNLSRLEEDQIRDINSLGMVWDTAGWVNFLAGDLTTAERQIEAAWTLSQNGMEADIISP